MKIADESLRKCVAGESPMQFWKEKVPVKVWVRLAAMRLFSARPTSCSVERLWNVFGDVLSKKRRATNKGRVAKLVHARMNMNLIPNDKLPEQSDVNLDELFNSAFEAVADMDEEEEVALAAAKHASLAEHMDSESGFEDVSSESDDASLNGNDFC
jgi:hypothetical protein